MAELITHDGTVKTDELCSPGYVSFRCDAWGLDDNTQGKVGWHVMYRPLNSQYTDPAEVTDAMRLAVEEHYAEREAAERRQEDERRAKMAADHKAAKPLPADVQALVKRYRTSEAAWEAEDEMAWATLNRYGY